MTNDRPFPDKTAHALKHYCCTDIIRRTGGNISLAKMLMRHRDVRSTVRYDHPNLDDLRGAINRRRRLITAYLGPLDDNLVSP